VGTALASLSVAPGQAVEITGAKRQDERGQRFLARELRAGSRVLVLRDADGVPVGA